MLTILTLNILLMIVYLSHWDWNLYKSRKDIVYSISEKTFLAMSPEGDYITELTETYSKFIEWRINREKLIDIKGISNLIKKTTPDEIYHLGSQSYINYDFDSEFFKLNPNINGTNYLLGAIKKFSPKTKFYFAGTSEIFGNACEEPVSYTHLTLPTNREV